MTFEVKKLFLEGVEGIVEYNEIEDSHQLNIGWCGLGLYPIWEHFEGKKIRIKVELLDGGEK